MIKVFEVLLKPKPISFSLRPIYPISLFFIGLFIGAFFLFFGSSVKIQGSWTMQGKTKETNFIETLTIKKDSFRIDRTGGSVGSIDIKISEFNNKYETFKGTVIDSNGAYKIIGNPEVFFKYKLIDNNKRLAFGIDYQNYPVLTPYGFYVKNILK